MNPGERETKLNGDAKYICDKIGDLKLDLNVMKGDISAMSAKLDRHIGHCAAIQVEKERRFGSVEARLQSNDVKTDSVFNAKERVFWILITVLLSASLAAIGLK